MKTKIFKFGVPVMMGLALMIMSIIIGCDEVDITGPKKNCTNSAYPLWCSNAKVCCARGFAYYCDGLCYESSCPGGTITMDDCRPE